MNDKIYIKGARENNLKNVDVEIHSFFFFLLHFPAYGILSSLTRD